jgi:Ca2+-binding RTX toxin-like protein
MTTKSGAELITQYVQDGADIPFFSEISFDPYTTNETWPQKNYSDNVRYSSTSSGGTQLTFLNKSTVVKGVETTGLDITIVGSDSKKLVQIWTKNRSANDGFGPIKSAFKLDWSDPGETKAKTDDVKISVVISANDTLQAFGSAGWKFTGGSSLSVTYDYGSGIKQLKVQGSDTYTINGSGSTTSYDLNTTKITNLSYVDLSGDSVFKFSLSGSKTTDTIQNTESFSWKNIATQVGDLKITTKVFSSSSASINFSLDNIFDIESDTALFRDRWMALIEKGNNSFVGGSSVDIIDASDGNDSLLGADGDDFLDGGAGSDKLTGGAGADTFIFRSGESAVSAITSDQITDFKYSQGDQINLEGLSNVACHVRDIKSPTFSAALIDANKDFSEGDNISIQFVGNNALMFVDLNADQQADLMVTLVGLKVRDTVFTDYAEAGNMFV